MSSVNSELTSAIREVMYHSQDMSPTAALQKVAEDRGLSVEKTARVAEAVNNLRVLHMYKTSADKSQDIDLADAAIAIKQAHLTDKSPARLNKTASVRQLDMYYSNGSDEFFLDARSAELRAPLFDQMFKQADLHDPNVPHAPEYRGLSPLPKLLNKYAALKQLTSDAEIAKQNTRDELELGLLKAARDLKRIPEFDFSSFEKAAYLMYGKQVRPLITALAATNNWERLPAGEKIAHALVNDRSVEQKLLAGLIEKFAAYTKAFQAAKEATMANKIYEAAVVGQIKKAAARSAYDPSRSALHGIDPLHTTPVSGERSTVDMLAEQMNRRPDPPDASAFGVLGQMSRTGAPVQSAVHQQLAEKAQHPVNQELQELLAEFADSPEWDIINREGKVVGKNKAKMYQDLYRIMEQRKKALGASAGGSEKDKKKGLEIPYPKSIYERSKVVRPGLTDMFGGIMGTLKDVGSLVGPSPKKPSLNAGKIRGIAQYAVDSDPILKERNPHAIIQAYKTMLTVSPTLAQDPNAAISFLRHATMGDTVSYVALKDLADTEKSLRDQSRPDKK